MENQLAFWSVEHHARHFPLPDSGTDSPTPAATSPSPSSKWPTTSIPSGSSGKTCRASSRPRTTPLAAFWQDFAERMTHSFQTESGQVQAWYLARNARCPGAFSMLNTSEWPNDADVSLCALSEVLETGELPQRFFLSAKACSGILRRAEKRGKKLPEALEQALQAVATQI